MWNHRVMIETVEYPDGTNEYTSTIHEVYYGMAIGTDRSNIGYTAPIAPSGNGETTIESIYDLKYNLEYMLEAVNRVIQEKTSIFDYSDPLTHLPGERSTVVNTFMKSNDVLDIDDAYMDEKYGEEG